VLIPEKRSQHSDWSSSALASLDAFERNTQVSATAAPEVYTLVRGLQRQLNLQRSELDLANSKIGETEMKLRQASADLMAAQEVERRRIAADLHDSIGQSLNALSFGIGNAMESNSRRDSQATAEVLNMLSQQVKNTLEEVRRIGRDLRPAMLDDLGIVGTLSWFLREFCLVYSDVDVHVDIDVIESEVPVTLRTPIYRVVQEALTNIVKHSGATDIHVVLTRNVRGLVLQVTDNGCGFELDGERLYIPPSSAGFGLTSMRDRVEFSGGDFSVHSAPGRGTRIKCNWEIQDAATTAAGIL
jgi:signal transduction histidine kinase